jgi:hypothetical protein
MGTIALILQFQDMRRVLLSFDDLDRGFSRL